MEDGDPMNKATELVNRYMGSDDQAFAHVRKMMASCIDVASLAKAFAEWAEKDLDDFPPTSRGELCEGLTYCALETVDWEALAEHWRYKNPSWCA